ncbi:MAG: hypothetical protein PHC99_08135 [Methylococcales bacterium]|nr:hypothetical protein [Methylococcales bacterium]
MNEIELCEWDEAIEIDGFYFNRAKYLGLPKPPRCFAEDKDIDTMTEDEKKATLEYIELFRNADIKKVTDIATAKQNLANDILQARNR